MVRELSNKHYYEMFEYMWDKLRGYFDKKNENTIVYKDQLEYFTDKIDDLLLLANDVRSNS